MIFVRPLTHDERGKLQSALAESGLPQYVRARLLAIRLSSRGVSAPEIACELGVDPATVRKWINTFSSHGLSPLVRRRRGGGAPSKFSNADIEKIVTVACTSPRELGLPHARWSLRRLRKYLQDRNIVRDISHEKLRQILRGTAPASPKARSSK